MEIEDLKWTLVENGRYVAWPAIGDCAWVYCDGSRWSYKFNDCDVGAFSTAEEAQNCCNDEHKRLIAKWVKSAVPNV